MKPIVLYLQRQNLIIGLIVAFALVFFLKWYRLHWQQVISPKCEFDRYWCNTTRQCERYRSAPTESFLSLQALSSLCNRKYTAQPASAGIPTKVDIAPPTPLKPPTKREQESIPLYFKPNTNTAPQCKFGIDVNPPSPRVKAAVDNLMPVTADDINNIEQQVSKIPEFVNILTSTNKQTVLKQLIVLDKLLKTPQKNITDDQIQHIATVILADINMVDPQVSSFAGAYYSNTDKTPESNPFSKINTSISTSELILDTDAVKIITAEPIRELSQENIDALTGVLSNIKIFMPYEECKAILTRNI